MYGKTLAYVPRGKQLSALWLGRATFFVLRLPCWVHVQRSSLQCLLVPGFSAAIQGSGNWVSTLLPGRRDGCFTGFSVCIKVDGGRMDVPGIRYRNWWRHPEFRCQVKLSSNSTPTLQVASRRRIPGLYRAPSVLPIYNNIHIIKVSLRRWLCIKSWDNSR